MTRSVAIVGNVNVDLIVRPVTDIPPPGTELIVERVEMRVGGAAATAALTLASLGTSPLVASCVGDDDLGTWLRGELTHRGIVHELRVVEGSTSGISIAFEAPGRDRSFLTDLGSLLTFEASMVPADALAADLVLFCGYFLLPGLRHDATVELMGRARAAGATVLLDTGWDPEGWTAETRREIVSILPSVDVFLPNEAEARALAGMGDAAAAAATLQSLSGGWVVVKRGARGCIAAGPEGRKLAASAPRVEVIDTIGAGDAFDAGLLYASSIGMELVDGLNVAVRVGSAVVSRPSRDRFPEASEILG